ncbi:MAG: hypothetical protein AABO41_04860 [Acidobacteriota bacterium]
MLIDPRVLLTSTFLVIDDANGQPQPSSTVFFVAWFMSGGVQAYYAVTTRHSISSPIVSIRFNLRAGGTEDQAFLAEEWVIHPSTDVAVLPLEIPLSAYNIDFVRIHNFAARDWLNVIPQPSSPDEILGMLPAYGTRDEIFTVGLFEGHTGERMTQPVARFGHIALKPKPTEKILAEIDSPDLTPINAFLVEMAVWKGQSGSPVFIRVFTEAPAHKFSRFGDTYCLIGLIQGLYPGYQDVRINDQPATLSPLQMGIGIVVPAPDIREALMQKPLEEQREKLKKDKQQNPKIRPSAASIKREAEITKESFEDILKRVRWKASESE